MMIHNRSKIVIEKIMYTIMSGIKECDEIMKNNKFNIFVFEDCLYPILKVVCYRPRVDCLYSLVPALFFLSQTEEPAMVGTFAHDRRALQQFTLNVHVKHSYLLAVKFTSIFWKRTGKFYFYLSICMYRGVK